MSNSIKVEEHMCGFGETIEAIIRSKNNLICDREKISLLMNHFNSLNPSAIPPTVGQIVKVPILEDF